MLSEDTWLDKIVLDHFELAGDEAGVERALADPDEVRFDRDHMDREVFYLRGALPPPDHQVYLKVVVDYRRSRTGDEAGRVVTAYATDAIKAGERLKWKRRS